MRKKIILVNIFTLVLLFSAALTVHSRSESQFQTTEGDSARQANLPPPLYSELTEAEKIRFIDERAQDIALKISNRRYSFSPDVLASIKRYIDAYAKRTGNSSTRIWAEDLSSVYLRATNYAPHINRSFREQQISPIIGLYIVMIETEYHECLESPVGGKGLFQFMPETARAYGVKPAHRCDVNRMAPAAARYMADRIRVFGTNPMSVVLAIASYNRSPNSVRQDLKRVVSREDEEQSFWILVTSSDKLDRPSFNVPKFFAAAIIGETPTAFGLKINPLSSYTR
jgi:hypothetical protein